jgi:hypothetical protein
VLRSRKPREERGLGAPSTPTSLRSSRGPPPASLLAADRAVLIASGTFTWRGGDASIFSLDVWSEWP